ncbi:TPA: glycosyltransferase family 4 protein [Escherichia coli]|uniref:Putative glycosyltranslocase n=10 Tax=Escherichia TaxID=561 RepID=A0A146IDY1_ECOLX|nr:glycosyltransferase family 4 protein [Escherichia coli]EKF2560393.1 glycosyltransferase family 4 protein [Escherichia coli O103]EKK9176974.1 glycosyltransferase family 4 protein [Escherichia coli O121]EEC8671345.1 glycosyltransferase family 4 protein [Escherichia coli]EEQ3100761.1 glycosyltransferase family 4 protein [Escherichia coli]EER2724325.1 glycosyltransferase family 4 protein [Escherichia coli]
MFEKILFVNESPVYGGHEEMFLRHINEIAKKRHLYLNIVVNVKNKRLIDEVDNLAKINSNINLNVFRHRFWGLPLRPITNFLCVKDFCWLLKTFVSFKPEKIILIQGTIEIGGLSLLAARISGKYTSTYLPITKKSKDIGVAFGSMRDFINKHFYYQLPHEIMTISEFNKEELINNFAVDDYRIKVVKNFIDAPSYPVQKGSEEENNILLIIGRIDLNQKRQDLFLDFFVKSELSDFFEVHIIGDGSDEVSQTVRNKYNGMHNVYFCGWLSSNDVVQRLAQCRCVIIPSKFEGVPLVMIEAIKLGKIVIASNVDGMKEYLPPQWLFDVNEMSDSLRIISYLNEKPKVFEDLLPVVQKKFNQIFDPIENSKNFMNLINNKK